MERYEEFQYLSEKIAAAQFAASPFPHLYIENFLSREHFGSLIGQGQIDIEAQRTTELLIDCMLTRGWQIQPFPGCTTSVADYLRCYETNDWPVDRRVEGFGLALRLYRHESTLIERLIAYFNSDHFKNTLEKKFQIDRPNRIETAIQKYLSGYEISPHPDIRSKCLTYLININTTPLSEELDIHTHLLKFKLEKKFIYDFWVHNHNVETDWVPWDWCNTEKTTSKNNSIVMFAPSPYSLHAVKLRYDHLAFQRTQFYGNLWYTDAQSAKLRVTYEQFDFTAVQ